MKIVQFENYDIYIGQNAQENDHLTFSQSKATDLWFHVKDMPGAHVVLRIHNDKCKEDAINQAAALAKQHSKGHSKAYANVDYCLVIDVTKPKRAPAGLVEIKNYKTILAK